MKNRAWGHAKIRKYVEYILWITGVQDGRHALMETLARIAWNVRKLRAARKLTQENLAVDAGVDRTAISGIERGEYNASVNLLDRLATAMGVDISVFFAIPQEGDAMPEPMKPGRKPEK